MDLNFPLIIICLLLPMDVYTKPTPRDKDSVVADLRRLIDLLKREKSPYDVNDEQTDTDPYDDNDEQTDTDSYEDIHDFDHYEEYVLPDDMHWGGDEWMELEEDGLGHGYDIIDNMTLGLDEIPLDLFASFEVFDGDEYDRPFIDFQNLPVQIAQNKDHHRSKYPKLDRRNFDQEVNLWDWTIPYDIDRSRITEQKHVECIERGIKDINELTCLNMVKKEKMDSPSSTLRFTDDGGGCWSYVGYTGWSVQDIGLSPECFLKATVIHEIMHAIGMQHEHQRADRDKYIEMLWDNIQQGKQNENMKLEKTKDTNPYDIESLLQYGLFSFKKTRGYTMRARDKNLEFLPDTANGLTFYDVMDITSGYQCTKNCKTKPNCIHGGFVGHQCKCMCPSGTKGATCQHIDSDCGKIIHLKSGESEVITSPNYPNTYEVDKECIWLVKTVDGKKIHLNFEDLHLPKNPGNNRCHHWLEVRYNLIGQTGPKRCGSITSTASAASLVSNGNLMMLKLNSKFAKDKAPEKGFKLKVTAEGQDEDDNTCLQGAKQCHINAQCIDYSTGYCCQCLPPSYGNGLNCLQKDESQRLNGKVYGELNGNTLDNLDMHAYIVTSDGRAYTAISRVPTSSASSLLTLNTIGGIMGWMFALPMSPQAKNGYMYTGGVFNRTATIRYQSGEVAQIRQRFFGHNALNNLRLETQVEGNVPEFNNGVQITLDDYKEEYQRTAPGVIKSTSSRTFRINDVANKYTWSQTIEFDECQHRPEAVADTMRLSVSRNFVVYDDKNQIVRYAMTNKINLRSSQNKPCDKSPCKNGGSCVNEQNSYTCTCAHGWKGKTCTVSVNPCHDAPCKNGGTCSRNGDTFTCKCATGWTGNTCTDPPASPCECAPCKNGGSCTKDGNSFTCTCTTEWTGKCCTDPVNPCESAPCRNGGSCTKDSNSFTCACTTGWTGKTCSDPVSPCESAPCMNGGTCTKDGYSFTCACTTGWTGKNCAEQQSHPCYNFPCKENEICEVNGDSYACTPDQDLEENNGADHNEQPCDSSPCKNNELCENVGDTFICRCVEWYEGTPCTEQPHLPCDNFPCKDNEICEVIGDSYTCTPDQGLGDKNSDNEVLPCDDIAQCHHELCESKSDSFMCQCTTNTGTICSKTPMELQCTFETQKCFLFDDYTVKQASERSFISAAASGSKFVMADHSEPIVVLRINKNTTKLTSGQQYCLSFKYIIGGKPDSAFIEVGSDYHKSATPGWTSANYQFTNDYPMITMFVYDEDSYGAIDDVILSPGPCGNWNTVTIVTI